ncbi:MAG: HDOD domain-containing protein [Nibricoccus sp.]
MIVARPQASELLALAQQLPASPQILLKLEMLISNLNCTLEEIAVLLRRDATLAARIIRISNGAAYGGETQVASVEDAVARVGFSEVYRLTGLAVAAQLANEDLPFYGHNGQQLRDNTLITALAVEALARRSRIDSRAAYATALLRSMGKLVLDRYVKKHLTPMQHFNRSGVPTLMTWEEKILGCNNTTVAATILEAWHFPPAITEPIKQHYLIEPPTGEHTQITHLLNVASGLACDLGFPLPGEANYWELTHEKLEAARLTGVDLHAIGEETVTAFEAMRESL